MMERSIRQGARGPVVREIQTNLTQLGHPTKIDSVFGVATTEAVKALQEASKLTADGIVGSATWAALHRRVPQVRAPSPGFDPFDPDDYAAWLRSLGHDIGAVIDETSDRATAALGALLRFGAAAAHASPSRPTAKHAVVSTDPIITASQNRAHQRIEFPGYQGRGYIAQNYLKYEGYEVRLVGKRVVRPYLGGIKNECAQFVQLFGVPRTVTWRRGPQVCLLQPGTLPAGTVVATLRDGVYHNDYSGRSHVGLYLSHSAYDIRKGNANSGGIVLLDQWNGAEITKRTKFYSSDANKDGRRAKKAWEDSSGVKHLRRHDWGKDGEEYFVVLTD